MTDFKGIIFDFDGTILDSMEPWEQIGYDFLIKRGIKGIPIELQEQLRPLGFLETVEFLVKHFNLDCSVEQAWDEIVGMVEEIYAEIAQLKPHTLALLNKLKEEGKKMCIATATDGSLAAIAMKRLEIDTYFEFLINCDDVGASKDVPTIYHEAVRRLGLDVNEVAVVEDSPTAARTAKNAGYHVIGVYEPMYEQCKTEMKKLCDRYIESFEELL